MSSGHHHDEPRWGYDNNQQIVGPNEWSKYYRTGQHQSPINILVDFCALNGPNGSSHHHNKHPQRSPANLTCSNSGALPGDTVSLAAGLRRTHLNSIGEDEHPRSSSTSSSHSASFSSSNSSSPVQANDSCDEDYDDMTTLKTSVLRRANLTAASSATTKCVDCFPSAVISKISRAASLDQQSTRHCVSNKKLFLGYPRYMKVKLSNTGHSWQINIPPELAAHTLLSGPPLGDREYRLAQVHAHWGQDCNHGSEHQVNGKSFAAELHFVHWNCSDFQSIGEAANHKHGLAVLGVLVMALEGEHNRNKHLDKIVAALNLVKNPTNSAELKTKLDLKKLFPGGRLDCILESDYMLNESD